MSERPPVLDAPDPRTPRQRDLIEKARAAYRALLAGDGDALQLVPAIRGLLSRADAGADVLDELGNDTAAHLDAELDAAQRDAEDQQERHWQDYQRDREASVGPRESTLHSRRDRLDAILSRAEDLDASRVKRIEAHLDRVNQELIELRASTTLPTDRSGR